MTALPRDVVTELFVAGSWTDITGDVYARAPIQIRRGRRDEASRPQPSSCQLTVDNRAGNYSPRNPTGAYFGSLGRNTPIRLGLRRLVDDFDRTVTDGWGSTPGGQAWTTGIGFGIVAASDWYVTGGEGVQEVNDRSAYRLSFLEGVVHRDVDVAVTVRLDIGDVTGGQVEPANIMVRGQSTSDYLQTRVAIHFDESVSIDLRHFDDTIIASAVTVDGLTHSAAQSLRVRCQVEGHTMRAKVWAEGDGEPSGWQVTGHTEQITTAGWVGVRSGVSSGNTNTLPVVFSYDDFVVTVPRFAGEVSAWPQRQDVSGNDRYVPIEAAGITRRLGQGGSPVQSALRRGLLSDVIATPPAYWPCEDGDGSSSIAPALGGNVMQIVSVEQPGFGANSDFPSSAPLPTLGSSKWLAPVTTHTLNDRAQVRMLISVPDAGIGADAAIVEVRLTGGSLQRLRVILDTTGGVQLQAFNDLGVLVQDRGPFTFELNGKPVIQSIEWLDTGSGVETNYVTVEPGADSGLQMGIATIAGETAGPASFVTINPDAADLGGTAIGHISVHNVWSSIFVVGDQLNAWIGETAGRRIERLCDEESVPFSHIGDLASTPAMGPQRPEKLLALLAECADADLGTLHEPRGALGIAYRTRRSLYSQAPTLGLDYTASQVSAPLEPTDDDQQTRNDVTANRDGGSSARAVQETGRMSVAPPDEGGVGRYDHTVTVNVATDEQLPGVAQWVLHLGTVDETRYPSIAANLASPKADAIEAEALAVDVDDRVTIDNLPAVLTPDSVSQIARGYAERLNLYEHKLALVCAPESPYRILEIGDGDARLASTESTLDAAVTDSDTSLSVAITDGLWTTDAGEFPFDIVVGGERMTVSAVSGSSSPQTFTVTRSVNGVVTTHDAGTSVRVADPVYLGL